jgi:hypothetical protein
MADINEEGKIKTPDGKEIDPQVYLSKDKYITDFQLSYMDFMASQGLAGQAPSDKLMNFWVNEQQQFYQLKADTDEVMRFFRVDEKYRDIISQKRYCVIALVKQNIIDKGVLIINFTLTVNATPYIPGVTDNMRND